ncbi:YybH family protein [Planococcus kocurii]|uniref:YybH family protein n=1 Tax=Planococcus kocurii TaxID=1374 RepID=UPI003CFFA422
MFTDVQDVLQNYRDAVYEQDVEKFLLSYAPNVHVFDCWEEWEYHGIEQWSTMVTEWFRRLAEEEMKLGVEIHKEAGKENAEMAYVHGSVSFAALDQTGKELRKMSNRFTFVMEKIDDSWRIVHEHSSLPIDMESGKAIFG